uniref:Uncharacterized protein n=1 Tax=Kalanchoe fedtschenkoi TaxID=63787 RepID=A0A7N0VLE2_KALFE
MLPNECLPSSYFSSSVGANCFEYLLLGSCVAMRMKSLS